MPLPWCGYPRCQVTFKSVPDSIVVLHFPFGTPQGAGIDVMLTKKSKGGYRALGNLRTMLPLASDANRKNELSPKNNLISH